MSAVLFDVESICPLQDGVSVLGAAEEARRAGTAFLNGVGEGWSKWDFARWMSGPYRHATRHTSWNKPEVVQLFDATIHRAADELHGARDAVLGLLELLAMGTPRVRFVEAALARGLVVPCMAGEETGWVPVESVMDGLGGMVGALFVADYLVRPDDYRELLFVCPKCEAVVFDVGARMRGDCGVHEPDAVIEVLPPDSGLRVVGDTKPVIAVRAYPEVHATPPLGLPPASASRRRTLQWDSKIA